MSKNKKLDFPINTVKSKLVSTKILGLTFIIIGFISIVLSIIFSSSILTFVGLGLTLWGAILQYIEQETFVQKKIFDSSIDSFMNGTRELIEKMDYHGSAFYLPPFYLNNFQESKLYIPRENSVQLPSPKQIQEQEHKLFLEDPEALLITPPGFSLSRLFENKLGKEFTEVDINYLIDVLPTFLTEDLEIAESVKIELDDKNFGTTQYDSAAFSYKTIKVIVQCTIYDQFMKNDFSKSIHSPLSSALACAFAKATGKPITLDVVKLKDNQIGLIYHLLEPDVATSSKIRSILVAVNRPKKRLTNILTIERLFVITGILLLVTVFAIMLNDFIYWQKDAFQSLFEQRNNEIISIGIGLKLIHHLLIGIGLLLSGAFSFIKGTRRD